MAVVSSISQTSEFFTFVKVEAIVVKGSYILAAVKVGILSLNFNVPWAIVFIISKEVENDGFMVSIIFPVPSYMQATILSAKSG